MASVLSVCALFVLGVTYVHGACEAGWISYDYSCYKFITSPHLQWKDAKAHCHGLSSHLVIVQSKEENDFVKSELFKLHTDIEDQYWTDGSDLDTEGQWIWSTTGEPFEVRFFYPGEPNQNGGQEDCLTYYKRFQYLWNDEHCDRTFPFVCEKNDASGGPSVG